MRLRTRTGAWPGALPLCLLIGLSCQRDAADTSNAPQGVDNASRAGLLSGPTGGSAAARNDQEALLSRFRDQAGAVEDPNECERAGGAVGEEEDIVVPLPQECGLSESNAEYGPLRAGSRVELGSHRAENGGRNWHEEMGKFVGARAVVSELAGVDPQGCAIVRVDVDGGTWVWRVRDLSMLSRKASARLDGVPPLTEEEHGLLLAAAADSHGGAALLLQSGRGGAQVRAAISLGTVSQTSPGRGARVVLHPEGPGRTFTLELSSLEAGVLHGGPAAAQVTLSIEDGARGRTYWSTNRHGQVIAKVDPEGELYFVRISGVATLDRGGDPQELAGVVVLRPLR